mmetsp:Transcript_80336/g.228764  ORF Transcript_80336/g.228764 Transcript_80336/m.228764 type:complete len:106 (+) Transcript_80336:3-320(+)
MTLTPDEAANPTRTCPSLTKLFGEKYTAWALSFWTSRPPPDCNATTFLSAKFRDDVSGTGAMMQTFNLFQRHVAQTKGAQRVFSPVRATVRLMGGSYVSGALDRW